MKRPEIRECRKQAKRFREFRQKLGLKQSELAGLLNVSREEISRIENVRAYPSHRTLRGLSMLEANRNKTAA